MTVTSLRMGEVTRNWRKKHRSASSVFVPHLIQDDGDDTDDYVDDDDDDDDYKPGMVVITLMMMMMIRDLGALHWLVCLVQSRRVPT